MAARALATALLPLVRPAVPPARVEIVLLTLMPLARATEWYNLGKKLGLTARLGWR